MRWRSIVLTLTLGLLLPAMSVAQSPSPSVQSSAAAEGALQPGDAVVISVWRQEELSGEFLITADGGITHPLLKNMDVAGVSLSDVEARLRTLLEQYEATPEFVIQPLFRVGVGGEVRQPDLYRLPPETTIAQAVAAAGGLTERGRLDRIRLLRDGQEMYLDITKPEPAAEHLWIRSGDQILVDRRVHVLRDYIIPAASIVGGAASVLRLLIAL